MAMKFPCPFCQSINTVGAKHDPFDHWPEGWHLHCMSCDKDWFITECLKDTSKMSKMSKMSKAK